jgi:ABC-2 type transport system permease protein
VKAAWAVFRARFLALLQYRMAAIAGLGTQLFWGFLRLMIFAAFYRSTTSAQPMTMAEVTTYVWLGQATLMLVIWRPDAEVDDMVRSGNVAYELLKPVDLYTLWFARSVASRAAPTLLRAIPMLVLASLFFGMGPPASPLSLLAWTLSTLGALLLSAAIGTLILISMLWTVSGRGITVLLTTGGWALSGITLPLPLFPDWAQPILDVLPFRGLMDVPFRLYMGHIPPNQAFGVLAHQLIWVLALALLGRALLLRGTRRLVVQGG